MNLAKGKNVHRFIIFEVLYNLQTTFKMKMWVDFYNNAIIQSKSQKRIVWCPVSHQTYFEEHTTFARIITYISRGGVRQGFPGGPAAGWHAHSLDLIPRQRTNPTTEGLSLSAGPKPG